MTMVLDQDKVMAVLEGMGFSELRFDKVQLGIMGIEGKDEEGREISLLVDMVPHLNEASTLVKSTTHPVVGLDADFKPRQIGLIEVPYTENPVPLWSVLAADGLQLVKCDIDEDQMVHNMREFLLEGAKSQNGLTYDDILSGGSLVEDINPARLYEKIEEEYQDGKQ